MMGLGSWSRERFDRMTKCLSSGFHGMEEDLQDDAAHEFRSGSECEGFSCYHSFFWDVRLLHCTRHGKLRKPDTLASIELFVYKTSHHIHLLKDLCDEVLEQRAWPAEAEPRGATMSLAAAPGADKPGIYFLLALPVFPKHWTITKQRLQASGYIHGKLDIIQAPPKTEAATRSVTTNADNFLCIQHTRVQRLEV